MDTIGAQAGGDEAHVLVNAVDQMPADWTLTSDQLADNHKAPSSIPVELPLPEKPPDQPSPKRRRVPSASQGAEGDEPVNDREPEGEAQASDEDRVWSAMVEIDPGFPFDVVWPGLKGSVFKALRSVHTTWPKMGWRSSEEMESSLRQAVETTGSGAVARGLQRSQAECVARELRSEVPCFVCLDREGAAAAPDMLEVSPRSHTMGDEGERREKIRQRIRDLQDRAAWRLPLDPMFSDILSRIEHDIEDDGQWLGIASAMERALDLMQAHEAVGHLLGGRLLHGGRLCLGQERNFKISVDRSRLLGSALWPVLAADPEDLRKGRLHVKYRGEEGEDGEGGGGVTRAFLTQAGRLLMDTRLGLLLPTVGGHFQLSQIPGFISRHLHGEESISLQPEQWSRFFGRLLGMAVAHECPLGLLLVPSLCKQLLGQDLSFDDLHFAPGLSDSGAGWYSSLRSLLAHHAPDLVPESATLVRFEAHAIDQALAGLEATMPSRTQLLFESLAAYVGRAAGTFHLWEEAVDVAACLLQNAKTDAQYDVALDNTWHFLQSVALGISQGSSLTPGLLKSMRTLSTSLRGLDSSRAGDAPKVDRLLRSILGDHSDEVLEFSRLAVAEDQAAISKDNISSDLKPLRPRHIPSISDWLTTGAKDLMQRSGRFYHEVRLGEDFEDFFDPQLGWLTSHFEERDYDANGVGDDKHGWAADGVRNAKWHDGPTDASWPRPWRGSDVIGFAIDIDAGQMRFALNGEWVPAAQMSFDAAGRSFFPAVSMKGRFSMHIPKGSWHFMPPDDHYDAWANSGAFMRPVQVSAPACPPAFERQVSEVRGLGLVHGAELCASNLKPFAEAVLSKALVENLQPYLDIVIQEFCRVVPLRVRRGLSWQQVQERISGQRLDPGAFVQAWRCKTSYQCCDETDESVALWWEYVSEQTAEELQRLLSWCTGFAAIPVTAWKFRIKVVDDLGCPTVNTCMTDDPSAANRGVKMPTMYLPAYKSKAILARRMEWAIAGASAMNLH